MIPIFFGHYKIQDLIFGQLIYIYILKKSQKMAKKVIKENEILNK